MTTWYFRNKYQQRFFRIGKDKTTNHTTECVDNWLKENEIYENYDLIKATGFQKRVDRFNEDYGVYLFYNRLYYDVDDEIKKVNTLKELDISICYLIKPLPSWDFINKIKIK